MAVRHNIAKDSNKFCCFIHQKVLCSPKY